MYAINSHFNNLSAFSKEVKVLSEVEKIWIVYDIDDSGELDFDEISGYLNARAYPQMSLNQ